MTTKRIKLTETIDIDVFAKIWKGVLLEMAGHELDNFVDNMNHLKGVDRTYSNWIKTWVAWSELSDKEDIDNFYGGGDEFYMEIEI